MYVHSGELVQVWPADETQRIMSDDLSRYGSIGNDSSPITPYNIPIQTLQDFYTPADDIYSFSDPDNKDVETKLNDGIKPVYVPGHTEKKVEININVNFPPIQITVDVEGNRENSNDDELAEKITAKLKDNFRGFREELVEQLKIEIKKELDI